MDIRTTPDVVHESEAQRQYPRVRIPATLEVRHLEETRRYPLIELSAGGFSCRGPLQDFPPGALSLGRILFTADDVDFAIPVEFEVKRYDTESSVAGCHFTNLEPRQVAALRHLVASSISGELVTVGEMLNTLSRNSFTPPRKPKDLAASLSPGARAKAIFVTLLVFLTGLAAALYAAYRLYDVIWVTHSTAAKVAAPEVTITMPRDGTFFNLVPPSGTVKKGEPIAAFHTVMLDVLQGNPGALHLPPEQLTQLLGEQLKGSIASPCDCRVQHQYAVDSQYVNRTQPLFVLLPESAKPYVLARFHYEQIDRIAPGTKVRFRIGSHPEVLSGTVTSLRALTAATVQTGDGYSDLGGLNNSITATDVIARIEPSQPIDAGLIDEPVDVTSGLFESLL